jgi:hypothetical protein
MDRVTQLFGVRRELQRALEYLPGAALTVIETM